MEHILTGPYNKPTNNSRRPPRGAYCGAFITPALALFFLRQRDNAFGRRAGYNYRLRHHVANSP
ncbi:MAG: hypothetical protein ACMX3H_06440 [Sodalis sp. (in: enterobacteria)]|uniref:hypothetical protein n=1 Tax=Sodalis sp. (in: enterobacteria) TaxID=1898979 RepID=UPI0039E33DFF